MKTQGLWVAVALFWAFSLISPARAQSDPILEAVAAARALAAQEPITDKTVPLTTNAVSPDHPLGTWWPLQSDSPPLPFCPFPDLPVFVLNPTNNIFLLDDRSVDYPALQEEQSDEQTLEEALGGNHRMMMSMGLNDDHAYSLQVYLANFVAAVTTNRDVTASFSIAGGTNYVPYDILMTTNLALTASQWTWSGIGYTSNRYTFTGQPFDQSFYVLAKPQKTMVVPWGYDLYGQCDIWPGITNAVQVVGGFEFSLALLNDGTVTGWGLRGATQSQIVPTNLVGVTMIAAGWQHVVALLTNGTVVAWGDDYYLEIDVPANLTNVTVISAQGLTSLALLRDGTVVAWGDGAFGVTNVPAGLSNVVAIACGEQHHLAVKADGTVVAWGHNYFGQTNVPTGLSNVVDVAAGGSHSVALKRDGTVACWGDNYYGETTVPAGLSNVVAIAAGGDTFLADTNLHDALPYTLALKKDGSVVAWGAGDVLGPISGLSNVIALGGGTFHALALRTGPRTPVVTLEPFDPYQLAGGSVTFATRGAGLYGVTYQWQTNGVNLSGATNAVLILTNVQAAQQAAYAAVITDTGGLGSIVSSNATLSIVGPPVIVSRSLPTNPVCIYGNHPAFSVIATSVGQQNGFPLSYQWKFNGTNIAGATNNLRTVAVDDNSSGTYSVTVANAAGSTNVFWWLTVTNTIDVTKDLLLIYNTNSADSTFVKDYYLAHRPMVTGANVLGIGCQAQESVTRANYTNTIRQPILSWLAANPTKRPQYWILFLDVPSRIHINAGYNIPLDSSVSYELYTNMPNNPFVTYIDMNGTNDCKAYIDKLEFIGTNYSPGKLIISAGTYGNTNYYFDDGRDTNYTSDPAPPFLASQAKDGVLAANPAASVIYTNGADHFTNLAIHITSGTNVAGYMSWGEHSALGGGYPIDGTVRWGTNSSWWIIETVESFNGTRDGLGQGNFIKWFSPNAFNGTNYNYLNTPVGAVCHTDEPGLPGVSDGSKYFGLWASGKNFAIAAWNSRQTTYFQAVGDPLITK